MRALSFLSNVTFSCWSKSFNSVLLSFDHLFIWIIFNTGNCFSSVNFIGIDRMSIQVFNYFHRKSSSFYLNLVRLHSLLNRCSYFWKSCINAGFSNTSIGCIFYSLQESIIHGIESNCESCVNYVSLDVCSKIYLANVIISNDSIVSRVWSVMSCDIIQWTTSWKSYSW